jgi:hypothetical protein
MAHDTESVPRLPAVAGKAVDIAARKDARPDAQSSAISDARYLRL